MKTQFHLLYRVLGSPSTQKDKIFSTQWRLTLLLRAVLPLQSFGDRLRAPHREGIKNPNPNPKI